MNKSIASLCWMLYVKKCLLLEMINFDIKSQTFFISSSYFLIFYHFIYRYSSIHINATAEIIYWIQQWCKNFILFYNTLNYTHSWVTSCQRIREFLCHIPEHWKNILLNNNFRWYVISKRALLIWFYWIIVSDCVCVCVCVLKRCFREKTLLTDTFLCVKHISHTHVLLTFICVSFILLSRTLSLNTRNYCIFWCTLDYRSFLPCNLYVYGIRKISTGRQKTNNFRVWFFTDLTGYFIMVLQTLARSCIEFSKNYVMTQHVLLNLKSGLNQPKFFIYIYS